MTMGAKKLTHILMIEEAHRLLKKVPPGNEGGTQGKSVEFFCNMLAEIRTFGQGIIIADQIPTKLAVDTVKNTNLKIVHRTVAEEDRQMIGKAMNMNENQIRYLSSLQRGCAAVYSEGDNRPKCVLFPYVKSDYSYDRKQVIYESVKKMGELTRENTEKRELHMGCRFCEKRFTQAECPFQSLTQENFVKRILKSDLEKLKQYQYRPGAFEKLIDCRMKGLGELKTEERICIIGNILELINNLPKSKKSDILTDYLKYKHNEEGGF
jgi:hypothetical protein